MIRALLTLAGGLLYVLSPIDLLPDVLPVAGWLDDLVVMIVVLDSVLGAGGARWVARRWPGRARGLARLARIVGLLARLGGRRARRPRPSRVRVG